MSLTFSNNKIEWKTQASFRLPEFAPIIREQGSKAFLEQREDMLPALGGARKARSAPGNVMSKFKAAGRKAANGASLRERDG